MCFAFCQGMKNRIRGRVTDRIECYGVFTSLCRFSWPFMDAAFLIFVSEICFIVCSLLFLELVWHSTVIKKGYCAISWLLFRAG